MVLVITLNGSFKVIPLSDCPLELKINDGCETWCFKPKEEPPVTPIQNGTCSDRHASSN